MVQFYKILNVHINPFFQILPNNLQNFPKYFYEDNLLSFLNKRNHDLVIYDIIIFVYILEDNRSFYNYILFYVYQYLYVLKLIYNPDDVHVHYNLLEQIDIRSV